MVKVANQVKVGDIGTSLLFTLEQADGTAWDLSGATVALVMSGGNPFTKYTRTCTVDSAANGTCHYILTALDTVVAGAFKLEVTIDLGGTTKYTTVDHGELIILPKQ